MRSLCCERRVSFIAVRYGVEHSIFHKNAHCSKDEGGKKVNMDVIACTVETPGEILCDKKKKRKEKKFMKCEKPYFDAAQQCMVLLTAKSGANFSFCRFENG